MIRSRYFFAWRLAVVVGALGLMLKSASSQQPILGAAGDKRLEAEQLKSDEVQTFQKLREGALAYQDAHQPILQKAARWYVNRVTWVEYHQKKPDATSSMSVNDLVGDAFRQLPETRKQANKPADRAQQQKFLLEYGKALTATIDEVLKNPMPIARINAARILARLGETGQEESADYMVKVLQDKEQLDAVKLYVLRGLKELFANVAKFQPEREVRCVQAVVEFLKRPLPSDVSGEEIEAFRYVRREAIRALAQVQQPALILKKKVVAQPALELLRVLSKDGIQPVPALSEQMEAALGVCQFQSVAGYQPDYAAQHLAYFLVEYALKYSDDRTKMLRSEAWKVQAVRLQQALEAMSAAKKDPYVTELVNRVKPLLAGIENDKIVQVNEFRDWAAKTAIKSTSLFKGDAQSAIKLPTAEN